eukprot:15964464-Heterocapsa_arctica.AAC.1
MYVDICVDTFCSHCAVLNALCTAIVEAIVALIMPGAARKRVLSRVHPTSSPRKKSVGSSDELTANREACRSPSSATDECRNPSPAANALS